MITFTQFQLHTPLTPQEVKQKLADFIDTGHARRPDYTKGYTGELADNTFTLRRMYNVERWFYGRKWESVRIRNGRSGGNSYKGYGAITPERSGTSLQVRMGLHRSTWITLGLFALSPFVLSAWVSAGVGGDYFEILGPGLLITLSLLLIFCTYYYIALRLTARTVKRDLQALLDGTWEPLNEDAFMYKLPKTTDR